MIFIKPKQFKANLHCHSVLSDGTKTPEELKEMYKSKGYSVLAITDHERPVDHTAMSEKDFLLFTGYEAYIRKDKSYAFDVFTNELHFNLFAKNPHNTDLICFNENSVKYVKRDEKVKMNKFGSQEPREYTLEYVNEFIKTAQSDGYIVTLNHPVWSMEDYSFLFGIEGCFSMEMCNYSSFRGGILEYNGALYDMFLRKGKRMFVHSADDNHNEYPIDKPENDSFGAFTMLNTDDGTLTYNGIFNSLCKGDFYSSMGPEIHFLEIEGNKAHIEFSDAKKVIMYCGSKNPKVIWNKENEPLTKADFIIPDRAEYVRFSIMDSKNNYADTRGYFRNEF